MDYNTLAEKLLHTSFEAGKAIMKIYRQDFDVERKGDDSPVTEADRVAESIILEALSNAAPDIPVVAEEAASEGRIPDVKDRFFLVDPLDGTKEFINKRDEFTVNIGLIDNGTPVFGVVYAPALKRIFYTTSPNEVYCADLDAEADQFELTNSRKISTNTPSNEGFVVVASRSHMTEETKTFLDKYKVLSTKSAGSSLKFCLLAAGEADLYPRMGPTMEWDTAAGHAVLHVAGGNVVKEDGSPLLYGKNSEGFKNPYFIAWGQPQNF